MEIENKYLSLLNLLIHDKRTKMNGIISSLVLTQYYCGVCISYKAYMSKQHSDANIFVEDFEKGNVVFLLPFGVTYMAKEMEEMAEIHLRQIKSFFGESFREDMVIRISEDERKEEIRKCQMLTLGLENWDSKCETRKF